MERIKTSLVGDNGAQTPSTFADYVKLVGEYKGLRIARNLIRHPEREDDNDSSSGSTGPTV